MASSALDLKKFYSLSLILLLAAVFIAYKFPLYYLLVPLIVFISNLFLLRLDAILYLIAFSTPLSVKVMLGNIGVNIPDEPLMLAITAAFMIKLTEYPFGKEIWKHPLTLAIILNLLWIIITSLTSSMPIISAKFVLARIWIITTGYFWGMILFSQIKNIKRFILAFGFGLSIAVVYTFIRHWQHQFSQQSGTWVMTPFFDDHTVYSAVCSIILVFCITIVITGRKYVSFIQYTGFGIIALFSLTGVVFSYSRASWLSIILTTLFALILKLRIKFNHILIAGLLLFSIAFAFEDYIYQHIRFNKTASGKTLEGDIKSIANVKTDESNVERINRWKAGWRMFEERPFLGFGPGTYDFKYSAYQRAHEMTSISSTTGEMGGVHSEYLAPLIESGIPGLVIFLIIILCFIKILMNEIYDPSNQETKVFAQAILLGLFTYFCHGTLNNFLNQDKASLLFWSFMGMAAVLKSKNRSIIQISYH